MRYLADGITPLPGDVVAALLSYGAMGMRKGEA